MRTLTKASALIASTAALTLGLGVGLAAPASADDAGTLAVTGRAFTLPGATAGPSENLDDANTACTLLSASRLSGRVDSGTKSFQFFSDVNCNSLVGTAAPGSPALLFSGLAVAYKAV